MTNDCWLVHGDCLEVMATMPDNYVTAIVTDPPYGLGETPDIVELMQQWIAEGHADTGKGFMNAKWDVVPGPRYWKEMYRIAKPGAYLLACCGTRTVDLMSIAIRFGGWVKFDEISYHLGQGLPPMLDWVYAQGMPKGHNISVAIDEKLGKSDERKVIGLKTYADGQTYKGGAASGRSAGIQGSKTARGAMIETAAATPEAKLWDGYNVALKPSHEIILCFRKPVDQTYAHNALVHQCGGLNIEATRVPINDGATMARNNKPGENGWKNSSGGANNAALYGEPSGRWPPNLIWDGSEEVKKEFDKAGERTSGARNGIKKEHISFGANGTFAEKERNTGRNWEASAGSAARFFPVCPPDAPRFIYQAKAAPRERNEGVEDGNTHSTVKPLSLLRHLIKLVRQPVHNLILDPFLGSGTTAVAALLEGVDVIGIEKEAEYVAIARQRLEHYEDERSVEPVKIRGKASDTADLPLFAPEAATV